MSLAARIAITFLMGALIFIGLPLLGWGYGDFSGFIENPARLGYLVAVIVLNAIAAIRIPEIGKTRAPAKKTVDRQHLMVVFMQVVSVAIVLIGAFGDRRSIATFEEATVLRWIGLCLYIIGFWLMHTAELHLGRHFTVEVSVQEGHTLVTDGPYRKIRHPRYLGIIGFALGLSLLFRSWLALVLAATVIPVVLWRIRDEEALLHEEFGKEWEEYVARTWRLIPGIF